MHKFYTNIKQWIHVQNNIKTFYTATYKEKANNNKHVIYQLYNMKLQKEVKSNPKQASCKKSVRPQECCCEKRSEIQSGSQEIGVMVG